MPLYEYKCQQCGHRFDALRTVSQADTVIACKKCSSEQTNRVLSVCFSHSSGGSVQSATSSSGHSCGGCSGGSCGSCRH